MLENNEVKKTNDESDFLVKELERQLEAKEEEDRRKALSGTENKSADDTLVAASSESDHNLHPYHIRIPESYMYKLRLLRLATGSQSASLIRETFLASIDNLLMKYREEIKGYINAVP